MINIKLYAQILSAAVIPFKFFQKILQNWAASRKLFSMFDRRKIKKVLQFFGYSSINFTCDGKVKTLESFSIEKHRFPVKCHNLRLFGEPIEFSHPFNYISFHLILNVQQSILRELKYGNVSAQHFRVWDIRCQRSGPSNASLYSLAHLNWDWRQLV